MSDELNQNKEYDGRKKIADELSGRYAGSVNGELTFAGAVERYFDLYAKRWRKKSTITQYLNYLIRHIVPVFSSGEHLRPIREYSLEDYDLYMGEIETSGGSALSESTMITIRRLIYYVVSAASEKEGFANPLWGSVYALPEETPDYLEKVRLRLQKSLTVAQETTVAQRLLDTPPKSGLDLGLLMMFALGLRNGEACGADFGELKTMTAHETDSGEEHQFDVLWIYKTVSSVIGKIQSGGKTPNADRIVPVPGRVAEIIRQREEYVRSQLPDTDTAKLPIVCSDRSLRERAKTSELTKAGKLLMKELKADEDLISAIDAELLSGRTMQILKDVRDPTAYLFRRNFVTHLVILGLTESEIQYVIGHDIEDAYERRNDFVTEDRIWEIARKLLNRPLLNGNPDELGKSLHIQPSSGSHHYLRNINYKEIRIDGQKGPHILIEAREPGEELTCAIREEEGTDGAGMNMHVRIRPRSSSFYEDRTVNAIGAYHRAYSRVLKRRSAQNRNADPTETDVPDMADEDTDSDGMPPDRGTPEYE